MPPPEPGSSRGRVYLVGAGPGDPGLLTVRARDLIATADVILHDRLIPSSALQGARPDAELLFVGKEGGGASVPQEQTEALMVDRAQRGLSVVRLKGGDPFVFGRGGEEARTLRDHGIAFEVVPGITSGLAAPAYAGIPVTHRDLASAVALVTGHTRTEESSGRQDEDPTALDWAGLAAFPGTLVFYMGVRQLPKIAASLIDAGRRGDEPAAVVERGTFPEQRTVLATLGTIADAAAEADVRPPSITVVGAVAALADQLAWREDLPLRGRTIAVTRARGQNSVVAERLVALGASVVQAPAINVRPLEGEVPDLAAYDLLCLSSPNAARLLFERLAASGRDARALAGLRVAAIGPGTVGELRAHGVLADFVPQRSLAEGLVEVLQDVPVRRVLLARAREARDVLEQVLRSRGAAVDVLPLYETVPEPIDAVTLAAARGADYITFTSSSTVLFFAAAAGGDAELSPATRIVSIGPVTSATLREQGLNPHVEAQRHDIDGLLDALLRDAARAQP